MIYRNFSFRGMVLIPFAVAVSLAVLSLVPSLLTGPSLLSDLDRLNPIRLIPLTPEEIIQNREMIKKMEEEPPPPPPEKMPEPELENKPVEIEEIDVPEFETPDIAPPEVELEPVDMEPPPQTEISVQSPSLNTLSVQSMPVVSNAMNLKVNVNVGKRSLPGVKMMAKAPSALKMPIKKPDVKTRFNMDELDRIPESVVTMQPMYPYRAKRRSIEGFVKIKFLVDRSGATKDLKILQSNPEGFFENAVKKALVRWKFKPGLKNGKTVETWMKTTIRFELDKNS